MHKEILRGLVRMPDARRCHTGTRASEGKPLGPSRENTITICDCHCMRAYYYYYCTRRSGKSLTPTSPQRSKCISMHKIIHRKHPEDLVCFLSRGPANSCNTALGCDGVLFSSSTNVCHCQLYLYSVPWPSFSYCYQRLGNSSNTPYF